MNTTLNINANRAFSTPLRSASQGNNSQAAAPAPQDSLQTGSDNSQPLVYDASAWTGRKESPSAPQTSTPAAGASRAREIGHSALNGAGVGALLGLTPALTIIGIPLCLVTVPVGAAIGAYAFGVNKALGGSE